METIEKLPEGAPMIGTREIVKGINSGKIRKVVFASNCPDFLQKSVRDATKFNEGSVEIFGFSGDQAELGTKTGRPFPVAMVGYTK
ncbi:MAG: ribosomal L7Ae/L30e/S12e/Gadd45 family protein [Candidatus Aenigmarchaeota archaeon]|nr:ribosomal L7Ae/L30e/S12e/Gadd45 family protein [Candidatus Aenigmarchaeota archaeon]